MAIEDIRKMMAVGIPAEAAKVVDEIVTSSGASIAWADVTGSQAGVEAAVAAKTEIAALVALTDSSGGTANDTIAAIPDAVASTGTDTTAATVASVNTSIGDIKNAVADLAAKVNAVIAALK